VFAERPDGASPAVVALSNIELVPLTLGSHVWEPRVSDFSQWSDGWALSKCVAAPFSSISTGAKISAHIFVQTHQKLRSLHMTPTPTPSPEYFFTQTHNMQPRDRQISTINCFLSLRVRDSVGMTFCGQIPSHSLVPLQLPSTPSVLQLLTWWFPFLSYWLPTAVMDTLSARVGSSSGVTMSLVLVAGCKKCTLACRSTMRFASSSRENVLPAT